MRTVGLAAAIPFISLVAFQPAGAAQTDLDTFMERVLARRDENWKKLQQYVLDERETLQLTGPADQRLYGFEREYTWYIRDGYFIRSPVKMDGARVSQSDREAFERRWLARERRREARQAKADADAAGSAGSSGGAGTSAEGPPSQEDSAPQDVADVLKQTIEPRFVSAAYFLRFKFDPGHYAFAGREQLDGREVLRIEYYPSKLFTEGRTRPDRRVREREPDVTRKMNKVSLVTLWIEPEQHQILQYTFDNIDMDFLPGASIVRVDDLRASMRMTEAFPGVWLPGTIAMRFGLSTALGGITARYDVEYHNYRLADVKTRIRG